MPLFRRAPGGAPPTAPTASEPPAPDPPAGDLPCVAAGCTATTGVRCAYSDRRDRPCPTAWCPDHREVAGGRVYCRRHAGVVRALAGPDAAALPDLETRAPSLIEWLARDLGAGLEAALLATGEGESVTSDPAHPVYAGRARERTWERSWRLCRHTGFVHRVSLEVQEERDTEVVLRVDRQEVARLTPPWIAARLSGEALTPEEDARRRVHFRDWLLAAVRRELERTAPTRA